MPVIGKPVAVDVPIPGSDLSITEVVVTSSRMNTFEGRIMFMNGTPASSENHFWSATRTGGSDGWTVTGDGARLRDGTQIRSYSSYPFSLVKAVNDGIRGFLSSWLAANGDSIRAPGRREAPGPVAAPSEPPAAIEMPATALVEEHAAHEPIIPAARKPRRLTRRRAPDAAKPLLRMLRRAEKDLAFVAQATDAEIEAFRSHPVPAKNGIAARDRVIAVMTKWVEFAEKVYAS